MKINPPESNQITENPQNEISPVTKMKMMTAEKAKKDSQYWIDHFKYKQGLINQLQLLKNEKPEKFEKISQISTFQKEQDILCDNLFRLNTITNYSQIKLDNNINQMKIVENKEEGQKKQLKEIFQNNIEKIKEIEQKSDQIESQKQILNTYKEKIEIMKNNIDEISRLNEEIEKKEKEIKENALLLEQFRNELLNREETYNGYFDRKPKVGYVDPLKIKKENDKKHLKAIKK